MKLNESIAIIFITKYYKDAMTTPALSIQEQRRITSEDPQMILHFKRALVTFGILTTLTCLWLAIQMNAHA